MNILTVIQARTGSTRLPGKILMPLAGKSLLTRMVERVLAANNAGTIVVATTTLAKDDAVVEICKAEGFEVFRGHPENLLDRHYQAALYYKADAVVKIPSDCPLIDPEVIDKVIAFFIQAHHASPESSSNSSLITHHPSPNLSPSTPHSSLDFVSNLHPATYPDGNDVEIMTLPALKTAWENATLEMELQHTTPYIWERPEHFKLANVTWETGLDYSMSHRWTIDYQEDYDFIKAVYDNLYQINPLFGLKDILNLPEKRPDIFQLNSKYAGVNWYRNHLGELKTIGADKTRQL